MANEPFVMVPCAVAFDTTLSPLARSLWAALEDFSGEHRVCWPGYPALAKKIGCSARWIPELAKKLVTAGLLLVEYREGKSNRYTLLQRIPRPPKQPTEETTSRVPMKPASYEQKQPPKTNNKRASRPLNPVNKCNIDFSKFLPGGKYVGYVVNNSSQDC